MSEIRTLCSRVHTPEDTKWKEDRKKLRERVGMLFDRCVVVRVRRANNEKLPWSEFELNMAVLNMETKQVTGKSQVADYQFEISINGKPWKNLGLALERKEVQDLHGTLLFNHDRFTNELDRFVENQQLYQFRIIVEGNLEEFLTFVHPMPRICKSCTYCEAYHDTHNNIHQFVCVYDAMIRHMEQAKKVKPGYRCGNYVERLKSAKELEDMRSRKMSLIEALEAEGYSVSFYSNRRRASGAIKTIVKRYFVANYERLLEL